VYRRRKLCRTDKLENEGIFGSGCAVEFRIKSRLGGS
jgi:hypothetical protein